VIKGGSGSDAILGDNGEIVRVRTGLNSSYPWVLGMVWQEYPSPFDAEVHREIQRYDDIDYRGGGDTLHGGSGNDIIHGQRGDDTIFGDSGEDELYGGLGADVIKGGEGNDIIVGDVGYAVRRFDANGSPILNSKIDSTTSEFVWHKDIVLEEVGNITDTNRISTKVETGPGQFKAEDLTSCSFWMVTTAVDATGAKHTDPGGAWPTDLLCFELFGNDNDELDGDEGDDVLVGQRGDDILRGGEGDDLLIGDAGFNLIIPTTDTPRIYQVYRSLHAPTGSAYDVADSPDFGVVFTADYELYPSQYRQVDNLASIIDHLVSVDDVKTNSNLVRDLIGVSALATTDGFCMQPTFRITPGFLQETQRIHGGDTLEPGSGSNIVVADDIRGFTGVDLTGFKGIQDVRRRMDTMIFQLSIRISTLEVDTEIFMNKESARSSIFVSNDTIVTDPNGKSLITGDSLTLVGRTVLGDSLETLPAMAEAILERMHDVEQGKKTSIY
jgi:Ca2+-binding RTX toxin-like protein